MSSWLKVQQDRIVASGRSATQSIDSIEPPGIAGEEGLELWARKAREDLLHTAHDGVVAREQTRDREIARPHGALDAEDFYRIEHDAAVALDRPRPVQQP